jgi:hypothetical protein
MSFLAVEDEDIRTGKVEAFSVLVNKLPGRTDGPANSLNLKKINGLGKKKLNQTGVGCVIT